MHNVGTSFESSKTEANTTPIPFASVQIFSFDSRAKLPSNRHALHCTRGFGILLRMVSSGGTTPFDIACLQQSFRVQQLPKILSATSRIFSYGLLRSRTIGGIPPVS